MNRYYIISTLLLTQFLKLLCIIVFSVDPSLVIVERLGIVPYSIFWKLVNPYDNTQWQYKITLLILDTYASFIYLAFKGINKTYILWQLTGLHWFTGFFQNVTVTTWAPMQLYMKKKWTLLFIPFTVPIIQKLPIGWSLSLNDPHIQCAIYCGARTSYSALTTYSLIVLWTIIPLGYRLWSWRRKK